MQVIINPGSGPVADATETHALDNIKHYITDCELKNVDFIRLPKQDENGRFTFLLYSQNGTRCHTIDMPGLPLDKVRFMNGTDQSIWDFPRLYLDGSSWIWCFGMLEQKDFELTDED